MEPMHEEKCIRTVDSFLNYMGMDTTNITINERIHKLKKTIQNLQFDNYYVECCMAECIDAEMIKSYQERMNATNLLISEIRVYLTRLQPKQKCFKRLWKR